ncbi:5-hydroxyisourate hydrolase [Pseudomonas aeruginosa PAK]|nr:5-hydroxyisourate hydrolase [Pseudomonas aeruginosa PAK]
MRPCGVGLVEGMPDFGAAAAFSVVAVFFVYNSSKDNLYCFASGSLAGCKRAAPGRSRSDPHRTKARGGVVSASGRPQPMGRLTTHVLDSAHGCPGHGIKIELYRVEGQQLELIATTLTNHDGRCDQPVLQGEDFRPGVYQLVFNAGDYYRARGVQLPEPAFLDQVVLRFGIASADDHYHVPLLISPYSYSTYRGS